MFGANSSAAKTFLSPTLTKRKREQLSKSVDKGSESSYKTGRRDLRRLLKVFVPKELISNEDLGDCVLFPSGEVLVFDDDKVTVFSILRRQGQDVPVAPVVVPVNTAGMDSLFEEAQLGPGPLDSRVLVCCSASGRLIIALIDQGNKVVVGEHHVLLTEDEAVTTVCRAGNTIVLGTSEENVYVVRYNGSDVQRDIAADRLQKNRNVFVGLLQTGAKLIGLMSAGDRSRRLVKLLPIPLSPWLVSVGNCLSLWGNWASVGEEKVAWEFSLKNAIVDDVSMASGLLEKARMISAFEYPEGRKHVKILDATLMQGEVGAEKTVLLILSAHFLPKQSYVGDKNFGSRAQLWFHTLELSLPASTDRMDFDEAVSILHRVLVCENVLVPPTAQHGFFPRFYSLPPSWRVFVSWTEVGEDDFPTVYCAQFDVLNQPLLQLSKLKSADAAQLLCKSAVNSQVSTEKILAFSSLIEVDGACFILTDGAVAAFAPKLTRREDQDSVNVSTVKDRYLLKPQRMIAQSTPTKLDKDTTTLLLSVALGKLEPQDAIVDLLNHASRLSPQALFTAVDAVSKQVVDRPPHEQYHWADRAGSSTSASLVKYRLGHRTLEDKLAAHDRLIQALELTGMLSLPDISVTVLRNHQKLLLCVGLSLSVQETQQKLDNSQGIATTEETKDLSVQDLRYRGALDMVALGMDRKVRRGLGNAGIESHGMSVPDKFYGEISTITDGILAIALALEEKQRSASTKQYEHADSQELSSDLRLASCYGLMSLLLSAVDHAKSGRGADNYSAAITGDVQIRQALLLCIAVMSQCFDSATTKEGILSQFSAQREGKRVKGFCDQVLMCFELEAAAEKRDSTVSVEAFKLPEDSNAEAMSTTWKSTFHSAKEMAIELLIKLRFAHHAFELSRKYLFAEGMMTAVDLERGSKCATLPSQALLSQLELALKSYGTRVGTATDGKAIATRCYLWLEARNRPAEVLDLGDSCPLLLELFLETRPKLDWMYCLNKKRYVSTAVAATQYGSSIQNKSKAKTIFSIAKLSSKLSLDAAPMKALRFLDEANNYKDKFGSPKRSSPRQVLSARERDERNSVRHLNVILKEMDSNLAVIHTQELLTELCYEAFPDPNSRVTVTEMVKLIVELLKTNAGNASGIVSGRFASSELVSVNKLIRCVGMGVGLLSIQTDMLEAYMLLAEDRIRRNTARKEGFYEDFTSSDGLLLDDSNNPNALSVEEINKQYAVLEELVTTLWSAAICFEAPIWQNMAKQTALTSGEVDNSILGLSTEAEMHETLLYRSIYDAVQEAKVGSIRSALIPEEGRDNGLIDGVLALSLKDLLGHGVTENEQASLVHVVKVCMHSAVRDALAERQ